MVHLAEEKQSVFWRFWKNNNWLKTIKKKKTIGLDFYRRKPFYFFGMIWWMLVTCVFDCFGPLLYTSYIIGWFHFMNLNKVFFTYQKKKKCWTQNFERLSCFLGKPHRGYYGINVSIMACVVYYSQEVFKRAILQPGPPQAFALQTVQEVIKPQVITHIPLYSWFKCQLPLYRTINMDLLCCPFYLVWLWLFKQISITFAVIICKIEWYNGIWEGIMIWWALYLQWIWLWIELIMILCLVVSLLTNFKWLN